MSPKYIYKIVGEFDWVDFKLKGKFEGSKIDQSDGFIHFSDASQLDETARKHFRGASSLILLAVDPLHLGEALKYEVSRGGALFPHLYAALSIRAVVWDRPVALDADGYPMIGAALAEGNAGQSPADLGPTHGQ